MELDTLYYRLKSLTVFRSLLDTPVLTAALQLLPALNGQDAPAALSAWAGVINALQTSGTNSIKDYLTQALHADDGPWPRQMEQYALSTPMDAAARRDIETLSALAGLDPARALSQLAALLPQGEAVVGDLPRWETGSISFEETVRWYRDHGCGQFARFRAFLWAGSRLQGISHPDAPGAEELIGYRRQREQVEENTRALLAGKKVNNALLFGDSGTGKSATVKSLLSLHGAGDLRLIEVEKSGVATMPELMRSLAGRRQKFILFLDDLSFDKDDMNYSVLKTILEGGLEPRPDNVAIYATSNRRNLVRQTISDRAGDEMDLNETIQEKTALADRFGLRVIYQSMTMPEFLALVDDLAHRSKLEISQKELHDGAVRWDIRHPGRSPRSAHQYIASLNV